MKKYFIINQKLRSKKSIQKKTQLPQINLRKNYCAQHKFSIIQANTD